jgi:N-acetylglucosamine-6-phosphate deacetylase
MQITYHAKTLFDGQNLLENRYITTENDLVMEISGQCKHSNVEELDGLVCPGFIDVQVNGGGGMLLNNDPNIETLQCMAKAHTTFGTTSMLPTVITEEFSVMLAAGNAIAKGIATEISGIIGVHFEGPHLSLPKKGIHPEQHIRPISDQEIRLFCRKDLGQVLVTVAPENVSPDVIEELVSNGVHVCLGHSDADAETVTRALEAGATGFTHLFNAMSPLTSREPGMVGTALSDIDSYCGLIVDFHHVHKTACKLAIRTKSPNKIMLVTDAMSHVGSDQTSLTYCDTQIVRTGDKLTVPDGTLAGSALDMASAVRNCHQQLDIPLVDALKMATSTPANYLGLSRQIGNLVSGAQANMLLLNDNLEVQSSWIKGRKEYSKEQ